MRIFGLVLIALACLAPIVWFAPLAAARDPIALFSQYLGVAALIVMGINQFLATRAPGLETIFGPLDRIYVLHKWLGVIAMVCLGLHDIIDAEMNGLRGGALAGIAEDIGEVSLYGLLILVLASVITFIPYHLWKWSHRLIGIFFFMGAFHFFFIEKPFSNSDPLGLYVSAFCVLGIVSYLWMSLLRPMAPRGHGYTVDTVRHLGGLTEVVLKPKRRGLRHKPGQFAFLAVKGSGLSEEHPFSLSGAPREDRALRFSIKDLGDYTHRLRRELKEGMEATVSGPFGHFTMPSGRDPQVWIGAGVGITPFLAFAESLKTRETGPVKLYYCVRERDDIPYAVDLERIAEEVGDLELVIVNSNEGVRLTPERISEDLGGSVRDAHVFFCGPVAMRKALKTGLVLKGLRASRFHFEQFEMRTGIGLNALAAWLWDQGIYAIEKRRAAKTQPAE
ncbi:ferredoxin reductase family protein [Roseibium sediminicola]|uniref:Ferredoxin reductase family protein n=1 Tax=Roseibium sediminicola TaxID=2933272 RepID=A0ABT0GRN2_9HYPH|nr:ferredoxin reductase family protein [Roseibium sp. CAU 1639]MCK7612093.1 ferredoxin reductase family protein [Roseibium sp. CAU 1639]